MTARLVMLALATSLVVAGCGGGDVTDPAPASVPAQPDGPRTIVFGDEATCRKMTHAATSPGNCGHTLCDFIPEGQTYAQTCGPYFQEGITRSLTAAEIDDAVLAHLVAVCPVTERSDSILSIELPDETFVAVSGPDAWLEWVDDHAGADCEA